MAAPQVTVLVVDDSAVARMHLVHLLEADPDIRVVATVNDGEAALRFLAEHKPSVVLMDINMPGLDGFETTRRIMDSNPVPIVICSGTANPKDIAATFRVLEAGAVACVEKPVGYGHAEFAMAAAELCRTVKRMAEVKIVNHRGLSRALASLESLLPGADWRRQRKGVRVIGIGASTGGPMALRTILGGLPKDFPVPILIVQHIGPGFVGGLADWLNASTSLQVCLGSHGSNAMPGHVYLAPDDFHMGLHSTGVLELGKAAPEKGLRPAVSHLFRSLARNCGPAAVGVLLTGMGDDGAAELKQMRDEGATTVAQDSATSVVHGMPGAAIALGGATHVFAAGEIAAKLIVLVERDNGTARAEHG